MNAHCERFNRALGNQLTFGNAERVAERLRQAPAGHRR